MANHKNGNGNESKAPAIDPADVPAGDLVAVMFPKDWSYNTGYVLPDGSPIVMTTQILQDMPVAGRTYAVGNGVKQSVGDGGAINIKDVLPAYMEKHGTKEAALAAIEVDRRLDRAKRWEAVKTGTVGTRQGGPRMSLDDREVLELATKETVASLQAQSDEREAAGQTPFNLTTKKAKDGIALRAKERAVAQRERLLAEVLENRAKLRSKPFTALVEDVSDFV